MAAILNSSLGLGIVGLLRAPVFPDPSLDELPAQFEVEFEILDNPRFQDIRFIGAGAAGDLPFGDVNRSRDATAFYRLA